jgi:hypothetical protein
MAGQIKALAERIIQERSKGNPIIALSTETKMILKGVNPKKWHAFSPDDPSALAALSQMAAEFGIRI